MSKKNKNKYKGRAATIEKPSSVNSVGDSNAGFGSMPGSQDIDVQDYGRLMLAEYARTQRCPDSPTFLGYPTLSFLAQRTEIRIACEEATNEIFRNGYKIKSNSNDEDRSDIIAKLEKEFTRFGVDKHLKVVGFNAEAFGNAFLTVRLKNDENELDKEIIFDSSKIRKGDLLGFVPVEPIWISPVDYNATNPLGEDYYRPRRWSVSGQIGNGASSGFGIHSSRIKQLVLYKVPDIYKPEFMFGGLSLSQMMLPYVDNFISVRDDIPKIIRTFRTQVWKTDMSAVLQDFGTFSERMDAFTVGRDNHGVLAIDMNNEELTQINTTLTGLHELQDSLLKLICVPSRLSVTSFTGQQHKGGLNDGDSERMVQQDHVAGKQQTSYVPLIEWILKIICINAFGEFYEDLYIDFNPIEEMTEAQLADIQAKDADTYTKLIDAGVVNPEQVNAILAADEKGKFNGIKYEAQIFDEENEDQETENADDDAKQSAERD